MPTSARKSTLYAMHVSLSLHFALSSRSNINLTSGCILTYPAHRLAHGPPQPCLLTDSQHAAGKRPSLP